MYAVESPGATTFGRARRQRTVRRAVRVLRRDARPALLPLAEAARRLRPSQRRYVGIRAIPIADIVGSDSRVRDFDRHFLPLRDDLGPRWRRLERAYPDSSFPPIVVHKLGDVYFVVDGHHRVAIARQRGMESIDAEVTESRARWRLRRDSDIGELAHAEQERIFMAESGLDRVRPSLAITVSRPAGYVELLETIQLHGYRSMLAAGRALDPAEVSAAWLEQVYDPAIAAIREERLHRACPNATEGDLFLCVWRRRRELIPEVGCGPLERTILGMAESGRKRPGRRARRTKTG
jgi:hypothetical protein